MAESISSDLCGDMDIDISGLGGDRGVGQNGGDMGGLMMSPKGSVGDEAGGTSIRKFTCICLFILEPLIPCHTAGPSLRATGTGPWAKRLEDRVGEPGQETGGETEKGGLLCTRVDAEEEGEEGNSVLVSPSTTPPLL
jgi:hypothetical protein